MTAGTDALVTKGVGERGRCRERAQRTVFVGGAVGVVAVEVPGCSAPSSQCAWTGSRSGRRRDAKAWGSSQVSRLGRWRLRWVRPLAALSRRLQSAVKGSMTVSMRRTEVTGNPPQAACSRMVSGLSAM